MARSDKRFSIYPAPRSVSIVGDTAPALNLAIECWATLIARAMADNSKRITTENEWAVLIEAFCTAKFDPELPNPGEMLATVLEESYRVRGIGNQKHYEDGQVPQTLADRLAGTLRIMDYSHAWAVILVLRWYKDNYKQVDGQVPWWTLAYRNDWIETQKKAQFSSK